MSEITKAHDTRAELIKYFPKRAKTITDELVALIDSTRDEPEFQGESLMKNMVTYQSALEGKGTSISDYVSAIKFSAYMVTCDDNYTQAYIKTFSHRKFVQDRIDADTGSNKYKELVAAASRFRKGTTVVSILTVSQAPFDLMFTGMRYKAVGILAEVMETARYDRDKINAAKELLAATKGPDNVKIDLDIGAKENSAVQQLNEQLAKFASDSLRQLEHGVTDLTTLGAMTVQEDTVDAVIIQ